MALAWALLLVLAWVLPWPLALEVALALALAVAMVVAFTVSQEALREVPREAAQVYRAVAPLICLEPWVATVESQVLGQVVQVVLVEQAALQVALALVALA